MKNAILMCRVSSDEQAKGYSLNIQKEQLEKYCLNNNINVVNCFKEDHSAKNFNRPEFEKFLKSIQRNKGKVDTLLVTSWDRFSRNLTDSLIMIRRLRILGIEVHAIEQPIDLSIPESKAMLALYLAIPEIDNDRRSLKICSGIRAATKAGRWSGKAPFGYKNSRDFENRPIVIPDDNAIYVKKAFKDFSEGKLQADIVKDLARQGIFLSRSRMSTILKSPFYNGKIILKAWQDEPEQVIKAIHKPIIDDVLFAKVQEKIDGKLINRTSGYFYVRDEYPLKGLFHCYHCDAKLTASKSRSATGRRYAYYHCNECKKDRFAVEHLNEVAEKILSKLVFKSNYNKLAEQKAKEIIKIKLKLRETSKHLLQVEHTQIKQRIQNLQDKFIDGEIDSLDYKNTMDRYTKQQQSIENKLNEGTQIDLVFKKWVASSSNMFTNMSNYYKASDTGGKQQLLKTIFPSKLYFHNNKCRTLKMNDFLLEMLLKDNQLDSKKRGQILEKLDLSSLVESERIELSSKQAIKKRSTCLVFV